MAAQAALAQAAPPWRRLALLLPALRHLQPLEVGQAPVSICHCPVRIHRRIRLVRRPRVAALAAKHLSPSNRAVVPMLWLRDWVSMAAWVLRVLLVYLLLGCCRISFAGMVRKGEGVIYHASSGALGRRVAYIGTLHWSALASSAQRAM